MTHQLVQSLRITIGFTSPHAFLSTLDLCLCPRLKAHQSLLLRRAHRLLADASNDDVILVAFALLKLHEKFLAYSDELELLSQLRVNVCRPRATRTDSSMRLPKYPVVMSPRMNRLGWTSRWQTNLILA